MTRLTRLAFATAASVSLAVALAPAASADRDHHPRWNRVLTDDVVAPYQIAVSRGDVYVADGNTATVSRITPSGLQTVATGAQPGDVAGVDLSADGRSLAYTSSQFTPQPQGPPIITGSRLTIKTVGRPDVVADLRAYEVANNPDQHVHYGLAADAPACAKDFIAGLAGPDGVSYTGIVDSHAYSVASLGNGAWVVADAGGNSLLTVDRRGRISTLAVLPPQPLTFTADQAAALGAPDCLVGQTYVFEPVPTDVEVGPGGRLWVTTLPGGPESPALGARGSLYTVGQRNGSLNRVATGFLGATNVAVTDDGTAYVTELFGGKITKVNRWSGATTTFKELASPIAVEVAGNTVYAATMAPTGDNGQPAGTGTVLRLRR